MDKKLINYAKQKVKKKSGIDLDLEIKIIGWINVKKNFSKLNDFE